MKFFWCIHTVENCHSSTQPKRKYIFIKVCILKFPFTFKSYQIIIEFEWISSVHILIYTFSHWNSINTNANGWRRSAQLKMKIINLSWMISGWFSILCPIHKDTKINYVFQNHLSIRNLLLLSIKKIFSARLSCLDTIIEECQY